MKRFLKYTLISFCTSAVLAGCGSSGSDDNSTPVSDAETGYFVDSAVAGVEFKTSSGITGTTDEYGRFEFKQGDTVEFSIGKLALGSATPSSDGLVTPQDLTSDSDTEVMILRLLQALDVDDDPTNGITIPQDVISDLSNLSSEVDISSVDSDSALISLSTDLAKNVDKDYDGIIDIDETRAKTHFEQSLSMWHDGHRPDDGASQSANNTHYGQDKTHKQNGAFDINNYPVSSLTQELKDALSHMGNEERLAYDIYTNLYDYFSDQGIYIRQLTNIANRSEKTHVGIVQSVVQRYNLTADDLTNVETPVADNQVAFDSMPSGKYDIPAIQELYDALYEKGTTSQQDALEVGCMVEVTDINDLDNYISLAQESNATDLLEAFTVLRSGSYNHYWAFDKGLKNIGVTDGCCSLGVIDGVDYCHPEYPQNDHTQNNGQKNSQGGQNGHNHRK